MAAVRASADKFDKVDIYQSQIAQLKNLEKLNRLNAAASGDWHVQTVKTVSASEALTQQIQKQKLGLKGLVSEMNNYRKATPGSGRNSPLREAIREQQALRGAMASQMTGNTFGKNATDLYVPRTLGPELDNARVKYGMINQAIASAAHQTVNWGKNTQWAGRQITVGLTMPLGMAAVGAAALALKVDQELTRVAKVYDTTATTQKGKEEELANLRKESFDGATRMAQAYGQKMEDILDVQAQLASTGLTGKNLHQATDQAVRIATLGEMEYQKAVDMTISLQTAFKLSNDDLAKSFDMMNAVENATSLTIQDIADAVPRAASALAQLGGTVQDMTVMMTAMKEAGVNPVEAANALKSATSRLLDPTAEAIDTFDKKFNINLKSVVENAKGNIFEIMKTLAGATKGFENMDIQQAINDLFGTYQFNRITALWSNLGDAMNGTMNQTAQAMATVNKDVTTLADIADQELKRKQESIQGRFKSAVEGMKAALVPLGMTVLQFITPIIEGVGNLLNGFNELSGFTKGLILTLLGLGAVVGPILMLVGIFANLFGNVMKLATSLGNLRFRFKALTAEEAAAKIMANNAKSAFNQEAQGAAVLASTIRDLTLAMEQNAVAQGLMMGKNGQMIAKAADGTSHTRQVVQKDNGALRYAAGSRDSSGQAIGGRIVSRADQAAFKEMQERSGVIATNSKKTATNWGRVGKVLGGVAGVGMIFAAMNTDAAGISDSFMNILMVATTVGFMFPGMFKSVGGMIATAGKGIAGWGKGIKEAFKPGNFKTGISMVTGGFKEGAGSMMGRIKGIGTGIAAWMPRFASVAGWALRIFGPIGILAGGALLVKGIVDDMNRMEEQQRALATSGKAWADAIGYTYSPGTLPGLDEKEIDNARKRSALVKEMTENNEGLRDALKAAGDEGRAYEASVQQALRALTNGATPEQARKVMEASLDMAGLDPLVIDDLMIRFDKVDLSNPDNVRDMLKQQLTHAMDGIDIPSIRPSGNHNDNWWDSMTAGIREANGGDLTGEMRSYGERLGNALADGLSSTTDQRTKVDLFANMQSQIERQFRGMFNGIKNDNELGPILDDLKIKTADELQKAYGDIVDVVRKDGTDALTDAQLELWNAMNVPESVSEDAQQNLLDFQGSYEEAIDVVLQGIADVMGWDDAKVEEIRKKTNSLGELKPTVGVRDSLMSTEDAMAGYNQAIDESIALGEKFTKEQQLATLNVWREAAGLEAATDVTQGFGDAAEGAAADVAEMAHVIRDAANAANDLYTVTADDAVNSQRSAMQGAWQDIMSEAEYRYDQMRENVVENIRKAGEDRQAGFDQEEKQQRAHFDQLEKDSDTYWENRNKQAEAYWDGVEKAADDAADAEEKAIDARIKNIEDVMAAEQKAEDQRKKIFEAEQRRIERMAARANSNIDFNMAINSGNLDEAAKISNDIGAREQGYVIEDAQRTSDEAFQTRQEELQSQIEDLNTLKEARRTVHEEKMEQIRLAREAALEALQVEEEASKAALESQRKIAEEDLNNRKEADRKATENHIKAEQDKTAADRRELQQRLRVLQEFIPQNETELRNHVGKVEGAYKDYGLNLTMQGAGWGAVVGNALKTNVDVAAAALQTSINWRQIAADIARQIGDGMGMTMAQVTEFLRTGKWPSSGPSAADPYKPAASQAKVDFIDPGTGRHIYYDPKTGAHNMGGPQVNHAGGEVGYTGGKSPGFSQADRVGVPRSAGLYPTEVPTVLKAGEFVVKKSQAQKHMPLLRSINNGDGKYEGTPHHGGGEVNSNDIGGVPIAGPLVELAMGNAALSAMTMAMTAGIAMRMKMQSGKEDYDAEQARLAAMYASYGSGVDGGSGPIYQRLFGTIKRNFPRANLNSGQRSTNDYHGKGMAVDLGEQGFAGGAGRPYLADMNRWIYDNFHGIATELIYNGLGDDRPNLKNGRDFAYSASTQAQHRNHVHWAMTPEAIALANARGMTGPAALSAPTAVSGNQAIVQSLAAQLYGWTGPQWDALYRLVMGESGFRNTAQNPSSTAYGMFQFLNSTWAGTGYSKTSDPTIQTKAGLKYIQRAYGTPANAYAKWSARSPHWYDAGGYLQPGVNQVVSNGTRKPEPVFTADQWTILKANIGTQNYDLGREGLPMPVRIVENVANGGQTVYDIDIDLRGAYIKEDVDIEAAVEKALEKKESKIGRRRVIS